MAKLLRLFLTLSVYSLCLTSFLSGQSPYVVNLETQEKLTPLVLRVVPQEGEELPHEYVAHVRQVFEQDLESSGRFVVLPSDGGKKGHAAVQLNLMKGKASLQVRSFSPNITKSISAALKGNIQSDRVVLHTLADKVVEILFLERGALSGKLLFTMRLHDQEKGLVSEVWESDYDGQNAKRLLKGLGYTITPQYVPADGGKQPTELVFVSYKSGQPKMYMASLTTGKIAPLLSLQGNQLMPTVNRERTTLAFICDAKGNPDLYFSTLSPSMEVKKTFRILTEKMGAQGTPAFSPDSKKIAFVSNKDGSARIYVMKAPTPQEKNPERAKILTKFRRGCTAPQWSPDGNKIAYCAKDDMGRQVFVFDLKTQEEQQLTTGPGDKENPVWGGSSLHIIYNQQDSKGTQLYLVDLIRKKPRQITKGRGEKRFPYWSYTNP